jgi:hypothetical protein
MSEEIKHGYSNPGHSGGNAGFEREDMGSRGVFAFMIGLAVVGVVIYFIIIGMYSFLDKYERSQMATASPLVTSKDPMSRVVTQDYMDQRFKENGAPMLETNERGQFRDFLVNQENQLNSYGWVDEKAGVAHIPIERAMELTAQRGLPVCSNGCAQANTTSKAPAPKSAGKGNSSAQ